MPITSFNLRGDWDRNAKNKYGYNSQDAGIIGNEKGVEKIKRLWSNSKEDFDLFFVRQKNAWKYLEKGEVSPEWVKENLGFDINPRAEAISIIYTNNRAADKIPMTAWTIAHRFGHSIFRNSLFSSTMEWIRREFTSLVNDYYNKNIHTAKYSYSPEDDAKKANILKGLVNSLGTMKSARDGQVRNFEEFIHEIVAQYLITGNIKFNPLPRFLITQKKFAWGNPNHQGIYAGGKDDIEQEYFQDRVESIAHQIERAFDSLFKALKGKVFVM
ncbi:MAG: hypothetical protein EKK64_10435 [Neisseriaceae bacterium]|nr:MAG: hypothetical protein EKK64_10435 [Neisseriaceae bacterium]